MSVTGLNSNYLRRAEDLLKDPGISQIFRTNIEESPSLREFAVGLAQRIKESPRESDKVIQEVVKQVRPELHEKLRDIANQLAQAA
jgi:hypothetical protein